MKKSWKHWLLAGVAAQCLLVYSTTFAADKVVVIPLGTSRTVATTCTAADEVKSFDQCWKTFNLGATQVATSSVDNDAYGDLYQWGRLADGHQKRGTATDLITPPISDLSSTDVPGHSAFITNSSSPYDWRTPQNDFLWQGLGGINNPCPQGFRVPTEQELETLLSNESITDAASAYSSSLKLVVAGFRDYSTSLLKDEDMFGVYWSSTVDGRSTRSLELYTWAVVQTFMGRAYGFSVRCLKD